MSTPQSRSRASALRQQLVRLEQACHEHLEQLRQARRVMHRGSFVAVERKCGKPNCACTRGQLHKGWYLSCSEAGRTRMIYVALRDADSVARGAGRYQRFRQARAELVKLWERMLAVTDELGELLLEPYPPVDRGGGAASEPGEEGSHGGGGRRRGSGGRTRGKR
jgi:hypothetical protein